MKEEERGSGSELGSELDLDPDPDPDPWKISTTLVHGEQIHCRPFYILYKAFFYE